MTLIEKANAAAESLVQIEANVAAYRVAAFGDDIVAPAAPAPFGLSLEATLTELFTRLASLARETKKINSRLGQ